MLHRPEGRAQPARAPDEVHLDGVLVHGRRELVPQRHALAGRHRVHQLPVLRRTRPLLALRRVPIIDM